MSVVKNVCKAMERIAPLRLAEKWDNVGLLLESPIQRPSAKSVLLTIDLTPPVLTEATTLTPLASMIISYHPPIFRPLSSLTLANPLQASLLKCAAQGISVYSPHTALDCAWGGINDWLADGALAGSAGGQVSLLGEAKNGPGVVAEGGQGRLVALHEPIPLSELEERIKEHLALSEIQVGYATPTGTRPTKPISTIAICAGSGGSLLLGKTADVYLTGEMSHHDVLAAIASGTHVVLCGHSNTERGYLPVLADKLQAELDAEEPGLDVYVSQQDRHPLVFVQTK